MRTRTAIVIVGAAVIAATISPKSVAQADVYGQTEAAKNGKIYFSGSAGTCAISGSQDLGACTNKVTSIIQRGYTADKPNARLYWGAGFTGAYACIEPGFTWSESSSGPYTTFELGSGPGLHESIWNNIASVRWTNAPC